MAEPVYRLEGDPSGSRISVVCSWVLGERSELVSALRRPAISAGLGVLVLLAVSVGGGSAAGSARLRQKQGRFSLQREVHLRT